LLRHRDNSGGILQLVIYTNPGSGQGLEMAIASGGINKHPIHSSVAEHEKSASPYSGIDHERVSHGRGSYGTGCAEKPSITSTHVPVPPQGKAAEHGGPVLRGTQALALAQVRLEMQKCTSSIDDVQAAGAVQLREKFPGSLRERFSDKYMTFVYETLGLRNNYNCSWIELTSAPQHSDFWSE